MGRSFSVSGSRGLSPVVGAILLVVIAVLLGVVLLPTISSIIDSNQRNAKTIDAKFALTEDGTVLVTHQGGDDVAVRHLEIVVELSNGDRARLSDLPLDGTVKDANVEGDAIFARDRYVTGPISNGGTWQAGYTLQIPVNKSLATSHAVEEVLVVDMAPNHENILVKLGGDRRLGDPGSGTSSNGTTTSPGAGGGDGTAPTNNSSTGTNASVGACGASPDIVVDDDGGEDYMTIQAAVDNASPYDVIEVREGTYTEKVSFGKSLTICGVGRGKTVLDGGSSIDSAFVIGIADGDATIRHLSVTNYTKNGIDMGNSGTTITFTHLRFTSLGGPAIDGPSSGGNSRLAHITARDITGYGINLGTSGDDLTIVDVTVRDTTDTGMHLASSGTEWTLRDVTVVNSSSDGIDITNAGGNWTIDRVAIRESDGKAINVTSAGGNMTLTEVTLKNNDGPGIGGGSNGKTWKLIDSTITDNKAGILEGGSPTDWVVRNTSITDNSQLGVNAFRGNWDIHGTTVTNNGDHGIDAGPTPAKVSINESHITGNGGYGVTAQRASVTVEADYNYWNGDPRSSGQVNGNVDVTPYCTDPDCTSTTS